MISETTYLAARMISGTLEAHFTEQWEKAHPEHNPDPPPPAAVIETVTDAAFWASLRQEEGYPPKISLALLQPRRLYNPLIFGRRIRLTPHNLVKLSPAVEHPGVHLGVWYDEDDLYIWGTTHELPGFCFVLEVVEPGLLAVKRKRINGFGKFVNLAILKGDQIKILDEKSLGLTDRPALLTSLLGKPLPTYIGESVNILVELATSMRAHGRGGLVLVVPQGTSTWRESVVEPITYPVDPPYCAITELMQQDQEKRQTPEWRESLIRAIDIVGGFTAVDGATVLTQRHEMLAFGVKIVRAPMREPVEQVMVSEPVSGEEPEILHPASIGGTRHLAAAQFVHDQRGSMALVASQDGRFTVYIWSGDLQIVRVHRVEVLLL